MPWTLVRWDDLTVTPWKNGGGTTRRLATAPPPAAASDPDWSVSIAEIESPGPFSDFPGMDRVIMLIAGPEMILDVAGELHRLTAHTILAFPGDAPTVCRLPAGPARALNLMTRRGRATGSSRALDVAGGHETTAADGEALVLVALTDGLSLDAGGALRRLDSVVLDGAGSARVDGNGVLAEVRIDVRAGRGDDR
jgi:environmental stress-induced protein Ves